MRLRTALLPLLTIIACGPQSGPLDATTGEPPGTGGAASTAALTDGGASSTGGAATTTTTSIEPTGTGEPATSADTSTTGGSTGSSGPPPDSTGEEGSVCDFPGVCGESRHCTPEARVNADIAGTTPLGPFAGSFVYVSAALALGDLGTAFVVPAYALDVCEVKPVLQIELGSRGDGADYEIAAPVRFEDAMGQVVEAVGTVHVKNCCNELWFCDCHHPSPYELEVSVVADGWSIAGTARPNCCRSYSIDEAA